jgi:hypothetical protein
VTAPGTGEHDRKVSRDDKLRYNFHVSINNFSIYLLPRVVGRLVVHQRETDRAVYLLAHNGGKTHVSQSIITDDT